MLFSSMVMSLQSAIKYKQVPFVEKLEIDVRGLLTPLTSNGEIETFNIEIGEIKKSDSTDMVTKGYRQLWLRLAVISYALSIIDPKLKCNLIGNLYTRKTDKTFNSQYDDGNKNIRFCKTINRYPEAVIHSDNVVFFCSSLDINSKVTTLTMAPEYEDITLK
ncbi:hypothetical protein RhiirA5_434572 [Rhizophagus irregularis]|uniref:Uncharacterized protein n=1 Tax=Rhizophagus irregularis TaxID=588596 RepID=A0A2N0NPU8_9GLOM|nr:hypothetical protein RhiirA5_434572 [Rhizophagus irregularis]